MGGFGSVWHWVIVLLVIVLLFGAKKIPELAKGLGSGIKNFKKAVKDDEEDKEEEEISAKIPPIIEEKPKAKRVVKKAATSKVATESKDPQATPKKRGRKPKNQATA